MKCVGLGCAGTVSSYAGSFSVLGCQPRHALLQELGLPGGLWPRSRAAGGLPDLVTLPQLAHSAHAGRRRRAQATARTAAIGGAGAHRVMPFLRAMRLSTVRDTRMALAASSAGTWNLRKAGGRAAQAQSG